MHHLAGSVAVIYDANVLVFQCFSVEVTFRGNKVPLNHRLTSHTRQITTALQYNQQKVTTTQPAYDEVRNCIADAVTDYMSNNRAVEVQLGLPQGEKVPEQVKLQVLRAVEKHVRKLQAASWFYVDTTLVPDNNAITALKQHYHSQPSALLRQSKPPSQVDLELINFGFQRKFPLVTNDRGISNFAPGLVAAGLSFHIYNLCDLVLPSTTP